MRPLPQLVLVATTLLVPLAAAQTDSSPTTLAQAIAAKRAEAGRLQAEVESLGREAVKGHDSLGAFDLKALELRRKVATQQWRRLDAEGDLLLLTGLLKRRPANDQQQQTVAKWLEAAKDEKGYRLLPSTPTADSHDYRAIDEHVKTAPAGAISSVKKLADYLRKGAKNDREKARAVFTWMCTNMVYDLDVLPTGKFETRPEFVLRSRQGECSSHASLYHALATAIGLKAQLIPGFARQLDFDPGFARLTKKEGGVYYISHRWNAVQIDGRWQIVDTSLGNPRARKQGQVKDGGPPHAEWFLVPAGQAIYTHWPTDPKWQLLDRPLTKKEQAALPMLSPGAFRHGVQFWPQTGPVLTMGDAVTVRVKAPAGVTVMGILARANTPVPGWVLDQRDPETGETDLYAVVPRPGPYLLRVFAARGEEGKKSPDAIADYLLDAKKGKGDNFRLPYAWPTFREKGCCLYEPLHGILKANVKVRFKIRVPGAKQVMVGVGQAITQLEGKDGIYTGEVALPPGDAGLAAQFADQPNMAFPLVGFRAE